MNINCLIIEDDPIWAKSLQFHLSKYPLITIEGVYDNAIDALDILALKPIQIIFLDIELPKLSGIDFIQNLNNPPNIIITTSSEDYAIACFDLQVDDYILKPYSEDRLHLSLQRTFKLLDKSFTNSGIMSKGDKKINYIFVRATGKMVKVYFEDIEYIESNGDKTIISTSFGKINTTHNLASISKLLPVQDFLKIHRSYIVSIDKISAIEGNCIIIKKQLIPIGRNYVQTVKEKIIKDYVIG